jgi:hypothetical protein
MSWRWRKVFNLGAGLRANLSRSGVGWSWGIPGLRIGESPSGTRYISVGIPGTGLYFYKPIGSNRMAPRSPEPPSPAPDADSTPRKGIRRWKNLR